MLELVAYYSKEWRSWVLMILDEDGFEVNFDNNGSQCYANKEQLKLGIEKG
ncbi:hypothetical protein [Synechococcus phage BUCT-ZZ01]|nr:hypothetical protein [Synechococcus phage BUCT-ZZ01]